MARVPLTFRQRDVTAAIKAVEAAGHTAYRVQIGRDGSISVDLTPPPANGTAPSPEPNLWDQELEGGKHQ